MSTEYIASNFQLDEPLVKEHYIAAGNEGVLPYAVTDTIGLTCGLAEDEWMEEITWNFFKKILDNFKNPCYNKYKVKGIQVGQRSAERRDYANSWA